ncbi:SDR family oxidoreductase [Curtobacterium sp. 1310]|uniref:SDR family oxidoreductase n=1 Tax=unclassified Curtobacterium TaxID=257496 RepID=UPI001AE56EA5|nr:SDR family oxidoreductase [Curtobacterium sp. 1310]MBP1301189.1 nucleoside-diphosphate-sugar epimerase [Curtobacterium sp. 1310]
MHVFITGASGWIGSVLTRDLVAHGHDVVGLARSASSAERIRAAGAEAVRGEMADHALIVEQATRADATAHLAFTLDFDAFDEAIDNEVALFDTLGDALAGSGKALFAASGTPTTPRGTATEGDPLDPDGPAGARARTAAAVLGLADRGIRAGLVRMPRTVHGVGDRNGLVAALVQLDRQLGAAAYVGDGSNRWPAVHVGDAARLFRRALESAPAGSVLHAVAEEGVPMRAVAESISRQTGMPAQPVDATTLGVFGALLGGDQPASSARTRALLGWEPTGPTLLEDLDAGHYTQAA